MNGKTQSLTAFQVKQKTDVHKMANRLSYMLTGDRWLCQLDLAHFDGLIWPPLISSLLVRAGASPGGRRGGLDQRSLRVDDRVFV